MKRNEPFNPEIKSAAPPAGLSFRLAQIKDRESVTALMAERNPESSSSDLFRMTDREIALNVTDSNYRLFVAELEGQVVGLCRYYHSDGLPKEKLRYPAPSGWYCMGLIVDKKMRRRGIARFLFQGRLKSLRERGATEVYSCVDSENLASIKMHHEFGFQEMDRAPGFLNIVFGQLGVLYKKVL